jgi:iron transport multicopper oxidase
MKLIEADGVEHQPHTVDSLTIFPGQRYSVVVQANQPVGNYCKYQLEMIDRVFSDGTA